MDRIIKFRGWNTNTKVMIDLHAVTPLAVMGNVNDKTDGIYLPFIDSIVLQQFTGLLDDDGTEIFEGDIAHDISNSIYEIKFDEGKFIAVMDGNVIVDLSEVYNDIVVIGNIFENPELLK